MGGGRHDKGLAAARERDMADVRRARGRATGPLEGTLARPVAEVVRARLHRPRCRYRYRSARPRVRRLAVARRVRHARTHRALQTAGLRSRLEGIRRSGEVTAPATPRARRT